MRRVTLKKVQTPIKKKRGRKKGKIGHIKIDPNSHLLHKRIGLRGSCTCAACNQHYRKIIKERLNQVLIQKKMYD